MTISGKRRGIDKVKTGIEGFDAITGGGLPRGRPTLVCGGAGCGKTLFSLFFLVHGIVACDESGVFVSFEESPEDVVRNFASFGHDLEALVRDKRLAFVHVPVAPQQVQEVGDYDLEGLFVRIDQAVQKVGAKRLVLDTMEVLLAALTNQAMVRAEVGRLFAWCKQKKLSAVVTGEEGEGALTRSGLREYVADCVVQVKQELSNRLMTRSLRIAKYRGSTHGTNAYPFMIDGSGIFVVPVTSVGLNYATSDERISSGIPRLDAMLDGKGYHRGSTILVSGVSGTGKSTVAASFIKEVGQRKERGLYFAFEESESQIVRNMKSVGIDLAPHIQAGHVKFQMARPTAYGLETHLLNIQQAVRDFSPSAVVVDPISGFLDLDMPREVKAMLIRLADFLRAGGITALFTELLARQSTDDRQTYLSSIMDVWMELRNLETDGESNRLLQILKARGIAHSNQVREFLLTSDGVQLQDVYVGPEGVLTGAARQALEAQEQTDKETRRNEIARLQTQIDLRQKALASRMAAMQAEFEVERLELAKAVEALKHREDVSVENRRTMARLRGADPPVR